MACGPRCGVGATKTAQRRRRARCRWEAGRCVDLIRGELLRRTARGHTDLFAYVDVAGFARGVNSRGRFAFALRPWHRSPMKLSVLGVSAWFAVVTVASVAHADVGPISPARRICMGQPEGAPCTIDGKAGACQGPHPSRMYCTPGAKADVPTPAAEGSGSATGSNGGSATGSNGGSATGSASGSNGGSATGSNTNATSSGSGSSQAAVRSYSACWRRFDSAYWRDSWRGARGTAAAVAVAGDPWR